MLLLKVPSESRFLVLRKSSKMQNHDQDICDDGVPLGVDYWNQKPRSQRDLSGGQLRIRLAIDENVKNRIDLQNDFKLY